MIQLQENHQEESLRSFLLEDIALNYFLLLAIDSGKDYFSKIYVEREAGVLKGVVFLRKSGTIQCYLPNLKEDSVSQWRKLLADTECHQVILPKNYYWTLGLDTIFPEYEEKAYIAKLTQSTFIGKEENTARFEKLRALGYIFEKHQVTDALKIEQVYQSVFETFSPYATIEKRLSQRGRGVKVLYEGDLVSTACSEYERQQEALIVGVATLKAHRGKGLATSLLYDLCEDLLNERKTVWLQYDNPQAGKLYQSLGFVEQYAMIHARKTKKVIQP